VWQFGAVIPLCSQSVDHEIHKIIGSHLSGRLKMVVFGAHELSRTLTSATTAAEMDECDGINCGGPIPKVTFESWCTKESAHLRIRRRRWLVLTPMQLATYRSRKGYLRGQLPTERFALLTLGAVIADEDEGSVRLAARERPLVLWFEPGDAAEAPVAASAGVSRADSGAECSCLAAPPPPLSPASPSSATADAADTDQVPPSPAVAAAAGAPSSSGASGAVHASASSSGLNHDVLCPAGPAGASRPLCHQWATRIVNARLASEPSGVVRCAERFELGEVSPCPPPPPLPHKEGGGHTAERRRPPHSVLVCLSPAGARVWRLRDRLPRHLPHLWPRVRCQVRAPAAARDGDGPAGGGCAAHLPGPPARGPPGWLLRRRAPHGLPRHGAASRRRPLRTGESSRPPRWRASAWPLHDISIVNIMWYILQ